MSNPPTYKNQFLSLTDGNYRPMRHPNHATCDQWGTAMNLAFDIAAACYSRGLADGGLDYTPGVFGPEEIEDEWRRDTLMAMPDQELIKLAQFTSGVLNMLQHNDKDY